ncbi:MAG: Na+/H+ antiporter subunit C [Rhodobacteraceae bacterium]|jgi:multicomponent K+:H+ antiporter subunit C|nr:Na+/H+ antiporter subunit C [Paracoccaceae bacterium]
MEYLIAATIGLLTAAGIYLLLRLRSFPVIVGLSLLSYAVNVFIFAAGRLAINSPPIISSAAAGYTDPLPQALVLTAIVISFGMTAVILIMALGAYLGSGDDRINLQGPEGADIAPAATADRGA